MIVRWTHQPDVLGHNVTTSGSVGQLDLEYFMKASIKG